MRSQKTKRLVLPVMAVWAMRDLGRNSGRSMLLFIALCTLVCVVATPLLLTETLALSSEMILRQGPSLVIRRVAAGGWATLPAKNSIERIEAVPGVLAVRTRIWGVSNANGSPVTLVGVEEQQEKSNSPPSGLSMDISPGEAIAGAGASLVVGDQVTLGTEKKRSIKIITLLPVEASIVSHDLLFLHADDCRAILGIPQGEASDLVVDVYHESEEQAIIADLADALPWPVQIVTRTDMIAVYRGGLSRRGGIGLLLVIPALLSLLLLVVTMLKQGLDSRKEMGILKSMGWTSRDIARLHFWKAVLLGFPAVLLGAVFAYALIFTPAVSWIALLFFGWQGTPPEFVFSSKGSFSLLLMVSCLVFFPFIAAVIGPVLLSSTADPVELIRKE